jgi:hypothetical protein
LRSTPAKPETARTGFHAGPEADRHNRHRNETMTTTEYNAWKKATEASRYHWTVDQCQLANSGRYLIFKGGTAGQFVTVEQDGTASIGTYEGAIPCTPGSSRTRTTR